MVQYNPSIRYFKIGSDFEPQKVESLKIEKKKRKSIPFVFLNVGFYIITPLLIAVPLGLFLDGKFHTKPGITLFLIGLGFISTMFNLFRLINNEKRTTGN